MEAPFIEGMGLGSTGPIQALRATLDSLECQPESREDEIKLALSKASLSKLKCSLRKQAEALETAPAFRLSQEFTRRGIAPAFRGIPVQDNAVWWKDNPEAGFILLRADLEWVVTRYPNHKPAWLRLESAFKPDKLKKTAEYLHWGGQREPGQAAKAMGLTDDQQRELCWMQYLNLERWRSRLVKRWPIAKTVIARDLHSKPWRSNRPIEETIKRRGDLWLCAELGNWKPQRTADFFKMMTGETLPRNVVAGQLEKLPKVRRTDQCLSIYDTAVG